MNHFKIGTNFDMSLIKTVAELNTKYEEKSKVTEFYGSIAQDSELAARPAFRLPGVAREQFEQFVADASAIGVMTNYTLNSFLPYGSKYNLIAHTDDIMKLIHWLEDCGVKLITIANPILLELIKHNGGTSMAVEISTCAHIDTLTQIRYYHDVYNVRKICGNLMKNRDFDFIKRAVDLCSELDTQYELMVNEFCGVGQSGYATHCIYRDSCYACHATNSTYYEMQLLDNYPMNLCTNGRNADKANWLRSNFIRPEDLEIYTALTGVNRFKITGRTASTGFQARVLEAYMSGTFDGDLLGIWKPLETIQESNKSESVDYVTVPNKELNGFINHWTKGFDCSRQVCGATCNYCGQFYERIMTKLKHAAVSTSENGV